MSTVPARRPRTRRAARGAAPALPGRPPAAAPAFVARGVLVALVALGVMAAGCTDAPSSSSPPAPPTTTTVVPSTTSTLPVAPQPTAEDAADALVAAWASGDRAQALTVATPAAVDALFAVAYPKGLAIARGCSTAFPPIVCTYGPPGGGPTTAAIYQLSVSQGPGGWYVGTVEVLS